MKHLGDTVSQWAPPALWRPAFAFLTGLLVCNLPSHAQQIRQPKWSLVFSAGIHPHTGWESEMAASMRIANLDGDPCGDLNEILCEMPSQPDVENAPWVYNVAVAFRTSETLEVALSYTGASAGTVSGYFDGGNTGTNDSDAELWVEMHARTLALSARYVINSFVRVGGGPSVHFQRTLVTTASDFRNGGRTDERTTVRPGLLLEVSGMWPARSPVFVELATRYSWASASAFGPYDALNEQYQRRTTIGATSASFAHFAVGVGAGFRF